MNTNLTQIADIKTGIFAKTELTGEVVYLQAKHFDEFGELSSVLQADLETANLTDKHLLRNGDVLFAAKGTKNFASVFRGEFLAVASTTFFVIRVRESLILPDYLAWILNSSATQSLLKRHAIGSAMVSISKAVLEELEISIPPIEKQKQILEISRLSKAERDLRLKIAELRQRQIQQQITNVIK